MKGANERPIAPIGQGRDDEPVGIAKVLKSVLLYYHIGRGLTLISALTIFMMSEISSPCYSVK